MKLITLNLLQTKGEILLEDKALLSQEKHFKQKLGYLPQEYGLYEELTVYQFLDYMAALKNIKNPRAQIEALLDMCGLTERRKSKIASLSGGLKQRVGIAQAFLGNPEILILDEPTVGLDPEERMRMRNIFVEAAKDKIIILSTHIIEDVQSVCNRLIVLHLGNICFDGPPTMLIAQCEGHVATYDCVSGQPDLLADAKTGYRIVSKIVTPKKVQYRFIGKSIPDYATMAKPSLEDAYVHIMAKEEGLYA